MGDQAAVEPVADGAVDCEDRSSGAVDEPIHRIAVLGEGRDLGQAIAERIGLFELCRDHPLALIVHITEQARLIIIVDRHPLAEGKGHAVLEGRRAVPAGEVQQVALRIHIVHILDGPPRQITKVVYFLRTAVHSNVAVMKTVLIGAGIEFLGQGPALAVVFDLPWGDRDIQPISLKDVRYLVRRGICRGGRGYECSDQRAGQQQRKDAFFHVLSISFPICFALGAQSTSQPCARPWCYSPSSCFFLASNSSWVMTPMSSSSLNFLISSAAEVC